MDKQEKSLAQHAETVFADLLESAIVDVASEAHRAAHLGLDPKLNIDEEEEYRLSVQARLSVGDSVGDSYMSGSKKSKHGVDVFGQTLPAIAKEVFDCMNCGRKIMAGRFAPHLEKCMGKGRRARVATTSNTKSEPQRKSRTLGKGNSITPNSTSAKLARSNSKVLQKNGSGINRGIADNGNEVSRKESKKVPRQMRKKAAKRPSRSLAWQI